MSEIVDGYIIDYISGNQVKGTPEEIEAVQPFQENWLRITAIQQEI